MSRHSGQPVIGVQDIDTTLGEDVGFDLVGKLVDDVVQLFLRKVVRTSGNMYYPHTRFKIHLRWKIWVPSTNVDMTDGARMGQVPNKLTDVHVHPAAVTGTGLC